MAYHQVELKPSLLTILKGEPDHSLGPGLWGELAETLCSTVPKSDRRGDLTEYFEERAAIYEYDGCLTQEEAERRAFADLLRKWSYEKKSAEN